MFRRDNPRIVLTEIMLTLLAILASGILGAVIYPSVFWGHKLPDMGFLAWIYLVPLAYYLSRHTPLGIDGIWWAVATSTLVNGVLTLIWFEMGRWKRRVPAVESMI